MYVLLLRRWGWVRWRSVDIELTQQAEPNSQELPVGGGGELPGDLVRLFIAIEQQQAIRIGSQQREHFVTTQSRSQLLAQPERILLKCFKPRQLSGRCGFAKLAIFVRRDHRAVFRRAKGNGRTHAGGPSLEVPAKRRCHRRPSTAGCQA